MFLSYDHQVYREVIRAVMGMCILLWISFPGVLHASPDEDRAYFRPDTAEIRGQIESILADPKFQVQKSFWQWLAEKFESWEKSDSGIHPFLSKLFSYIIVPWSILTLIAILCHFVWSLWLIFQPGSRVDQRFESTGSDFTVGKSFEELLKMARDFAGRGTFRKAVEMLMAALLKGLDSAGILKFHESKTNGDFIREYSGDVPGQTEFKNFVHLFEQSIYGGMDPGEQTYLQMEQLMEHIYAHVRDKA